MNSHCKVLKQYLRKRDKCESTSHMTPRFQSYSLLSVNSVSPGVCIYILNIGLYCTRYSVTFFVVNDQSLGFALFVHKAYFICFYGHAVFQSMALS